jgi:hypothetical protein
MPEDVEFSEEIRDLKRNIALHSEADSGAKNDQTQAPDKHPGTEEHDEAGMEKPNIKSTISVRKALSAILLHQRSPHAA